MVIVGNYSSARPVVYSAEGTGGVDCSKGETGKRPKLFQQLFARYGRGEQCSSHGQNSQRRGKERGGKREREREKEKKKKITNNQEHVDE